MDFWTMVVLVVLIGSVTGVVSEMYRARVRAGARESEKAVDKMTQRMIRLEERMANLETLVLDHEKKKAFADLEEA